MYRIRLTEPQRAELLQLARDPATKSRTRDRLEMVRLADAGLSIPAIARLVWRSEGRVRHWILAFRAGGFPALQDQPHHGRPPRLTPAALAALRERLALGDRTWTAAQLATWLEDECQISLSPKQLAAQLKKAGLSYKRTERGLQHKQDPQAVAAAQETLAALEKGAKPGAWTSAT